MDYIAVEQGCSRLAMSSVVDVWFELRYYSYLVASVSWGLDRIKLRMVYSSEFRWVS